MKAKVYYEIKLESPAFCNGLALETVEYLPADTYKQGADKARELSRKLPYKHEKTGRRIVVISLVGYIKTNDTSYNLLWFEEYENGKCCGRINIEG